MVAKTTLMTLFGSIKLFKITALLCSSGVLEGIFQTIDCH